MHAFESVIEWIPVQSTISSLWPPVNFYILFTCTRQQSALSLSLYPVRQKLITFPSFRPVLPTSLEATP